MIEMEKMTFRYRRKAVFNDFSLVLGEGKVYGLLGKNGAGKSTLLYLMSGLLRPCGGSVRCGGEEMWRRRPEVMSRLFIVPEEFALPAVSLKRYLSLNRPFYPRFSDEQLRSNLSVFGLDNPDVHLGALSLGQKKKVFMSFAMAANTPLLLMDEPTNGLDIPGKSGFRKFIAANMDEQRTVVISTHQVQDIDTLVEQVVILDESRVLLDASASEICRRLQFVYGAGSAAAERALYAAPSPQGYRVLLPRNEEEAGEESAMNLEMLFEATLAHPAKINALFHPSNVLSV